MNGSSRTGERLASIMPVVNRRGRAFLFDLDDTLIDRRSAFARWAAWWTVSRGLPESASEWLRANDRDGHTARKVIFRDLKAAFDLTDPVSALVEDFEGTFASFIAPIPDPLLRGLTELRARDWRIGVVTNGSPAQSRKVVAAGLERLVDAVVISAVVGVSKPDRRIFETAVEACGAGI